MLNSGSQTMGYAKEDVETYQSFVNSLKWFNIKNLDIQVGEGIDYSGDILLDHAFFQKVKDIQFDIIMLNNVLEHVVDYELFANRIGQLINPGGYILFSGPNRYPIHYDPIDNGFRPDLKELSDLFPDYEMIDYAVTSEGTYAQSLIANPLLMLRVMIRLLFPFYKFYKWKNVMLPRLKWLNKEFRVLCVVLRKKEKR